MNYFSDLKEHLIKDGQHSYRYDQLYRALTIENVQSFDKISNFPKELRGGLKKCFPNYFPAVTDKVTGSDCVKFLIELKDGLKVESVLIHDDKRGSNTVCCSSQVGCKLNCSFCATAEMGFIRDLDHWEIASQVFIAADHLRGSNEKITNAVIMGMGEPFLNYDNLIKALDLLNDEDGFSLGARRISVSTAGITPMIKRFSKASQFNLAISLHSPFQKEREQLMPIAKKYPLWQLMKAAEQYVLDTSRKVMLEYLLLDGINTSPRHLDRLKELTKNKLFTINLVKYHPTASMYTSPGDKEISLIMDYLRNSGGDVTLRRSKGVDIDAACGQLAIKETPSK